VLQREKNHPLNPCADIYGALVWKWCIFTAFSLSDKEANSLLYNEITKLFERKKKKTTREKE